MATTISIKGKEARRGTNLRKGTGWRLAHVNGRKRVFAATLLHSINIGEHRIAIFSVPKGRGGS